MKTFVSSLFSLSLMASISYGASAPTLDLVWPPHGHHYGALRSSFIFGSVQPPSARVTVNGQPLPVYKTGAFLAVVPLSPGAFSFRLQATSEGGQAELTRDVVVDPSAEPSPWRAGEFDPVNYLRKGPRRVCRMKDDLVTVTTGPDKDLGYQAFLPKGVLSAVTGSWGKFLRLGFGNQWVGWVSREVVTLLPEGTPVPHSVLGSLTVTTAAGSTLISIPLEAQQPFRVEQVLDPVRFKLFLYGVTADMDKVNYGSDVSCVKDIRWKQLDDSLCELDITTNQRSGWGYDVRYEGTQMIFEIRHAPPLHRSLGRPLAGLVVALDAGHSSADPGATGPLRTHEDAINLLVARQLEAKLKSMGAGVVMVRKEDEVLDLLRRTRIAWSARAHLFISLHENSIADSGNPLEDSGFSIYYWAPQSRPLAEAVHAAYQANIPFKDRGISYDNLAVCRMTQMPSILTESAFLIVPEQEAMLLDPAFRDRIAGTIAQGIQQYLKKAVP